ncbi:alanyl-tRNA editing protein [Lentibacillus lipolyticus]|nr:alanyl-tRNA editing protein [Lentibacillus lipolyticus]
MPTKKLYYQDQYLQSFTANLQGSGKDDQGRLYVVLDQTAFYPTGGGQPHDTGTLNGVNVYDVEEVDGEIRHYLEEPAKGDHTFIGEIDWERRFDHMQQHAGQHILSAAFDNEFGLKTVSFHLGTELCSIDLETANLTDEEAAQAEAIANKIILENRPLETKWVTENELAAYSLRKAVSVTDDIRLVIIPEFDYNGCGGTHPDSCGQVQSIKILHWEKQKKQKLRVYFVCGSRVLQQLGAKHQVTQQLTATLNAPQKKLDEAADKALQQIKEHEKTIDTLKLELIKYEANAFIEHATFTHDRNIVQAIFQDRPMRELQQLAKQITMNATNVLVLLISETDNKLQLVCSKSDDILVNMNDLVQQTLPLINGKGGGNRSTAQGGGDKAIAAEQVMEALMNQVSSKLSDR